MAQNALQVRVAGTGSIYLAPYGTTAPVDTATPLNAAFKEMGYTSDKGVDLEYTPKFGSVMSWQSLTALRQFPQSLDFKASFELEQWSSDVISAYFGGGSVITNPSESGGKLYSVSNTPSVDERAAVLEFFDGVQKYRIYIPRVIITDRGKVVLARTGAAMWQMTIAALPVDNNTALATLIIKDASFS